MRFELLGPVRVGDDEGWRAIPGRMPRTVLALLLLNANEVVPMGELIEVTWGDTPPASAMASLQNHVMRLRRALGEVGGARIRAVAPGYLIRVEPGELDVHDFERLCAGGAKAVGDRQWAKGSADLTAALALWRGQSAAEALGLSEYPLVRQLVEARLRAFEGRVEADLELGRHHGVISELRALTAEQPLREAFHAQLMLALYRADRQAEALDAYQGLRRTLADGLGRQPAEPVQRLHSRILNADPELAAPATVIVSDAAIAARTTAVDGQMVHGGLRSQLPADTREFIGRGRELDELIDLAGAAPRGTDAGMVVISAIDGMAGIGKTALAVHAAHRVREDFPDGQLFLDLHGYSPGLEPMDPGDALDWFLRSLGVLPKSIPEDLGVRAALYRDRLEGTRTLIILDNAASSAQVRPLLPGTPGCLVLVTSRRHLAGLDDAHFLAVDILPEVDAVALLHAVAGPGRIPAHHPAIGDLLTLCGHMPLAIRITAARLRRHPSLRIDDLVASLRDENARLAYLTDEDRNLAAVFDSSYTALLPAEQHLFRHLGLIPGTDFDTYAAANLVGADHGTAERLLETLLNQNLLILHSPGRYGFHDLIRVYAQNLCSAEDAAAECEAALERLLDFYQRTAQAADHRLTWQSAPGQRSADPAPGAATSLPDQAAALAWLRAERANLLAAVAHAAAHDQPAQMIALTAALATFLQLEGPWRYAVTLHQAAAVAAHEHGDRRGEANALQDLGRARRATGDFLAAAGLLERALAVYRDLGDGEGEAGVLQDLGRVRSMIGDYSAAVDLLEQSRTIYQDLGYRVGEANSKWELGRVRYVTGDFTASSELLEQALALYRKLGDRKGEAGARYDLGHLRHLTGDFSAAADLLEQALALYRELGDRPGEANALHGLGRARRMTGDYPAATELLKQTLAIYQNVGNRPGEGNILWELGKLQFAEGDYPAATDLLERALAVYQNVGSRHGQAIAHQSLGRVRHATGDFSAAADLLERALATLQDIGARHNEAYALQHLGQLRHTTGDYPAAADLLRRAMVLVRELGDRHGEAELFNSTAALVADTDGPDEALALYRPALVLAREVHSPVDEARALSGAARCLARTGNRTAALAELRQAVEIYQRIGAAEATEASAYLAALTEEER